MTIDEFYNQLMTFTGDKERPVEERIDGALAILKQEKPGDEVVGARFESVTYGLLTSMLDKENACHDHDIEMLQLLTLNAEAMVRGGMERSLKDFRNAVYPLIDGGRVPFGTLVAAVGRIVEALRSTVFNHDRYGILDAFIRHAAKVADTEEKYDREAVADMARMLYRLDNLLSIHGADDEAILKFISEDELLEIMKKPQEGDLKKDRIEYSRRWEDVYYDVEDELAVMFEGTPRCLGFCLEYWHAKSELLARKYRILWRDPHQMNPDVMFD